jgi:ABC-type nitrate/sulfonate/bicarbonate transport system permease component
MKNNNQTVKDKFVIALTLLGVYILLFEFILPINKVLPKPFLLFESFTHIWFNYDLLSAFTYTSTIVYLSILFGFIQIYLGKVYYLKMFSLIEESAGSLRFITYATPFFFLILFNFWFPHNIVAEFICALLLTSFWLLKTLINESKKVRPEYLVTARNLGLSSSEIIDEIFWKASLPVICGNIRKINYQLWIFVLIYEFIGNYHGTGSIYNLAFRYNDFTALFTIAIICGFLIWFGDFLIRQMQNKFVNWTA